MFCCFNQFQLPDPPNNNLFYNANRLATQKYSNKSTSPLQVRQK